MKVNNVNDNLWNEILNGEKIMSDKEAEVLREIVEKIRKEKGFRICL